MNEWKVYQVWLPWNQGGCVYKVGKVKDPNKPLADSNMEWNGFYSNSYAEAHQFAKELNKKEAEDGKTKKSL